MTPLSDLIARLEAAKAGSRELELDIALVIDHQAGGGQPRWESIRSGVAQEGRNKFLSDQFGYVHQIPQWTRSLDAALTLVPDNYHLELRQATAPNRSDWSATLSKYDPKFVRGNSATAPLAICTAALKARETVQ